MSTRLDGGSRVRGPAEDRRWLLPSGGVLLGAAALVGLVAGAGELAREVGAALATCVLVVALVAPLAWAAVRRLPAERRAAGRRALAVAAVLLGMTYVATGLPRVGPFDDLRWNWQGKLVDLLWVGAVLLLLRRWWVAEAGPGHDGSLAPTSTYAQLDVAASRTKPGGGVELVLVWNQVAESPQMRSLGIHEV